MKELAYAGVYVDGNHADIQGNTLDSPPGDIRVAPFRSATITDNHISGCASIVAGADAVVFAPVSGILHSNFNDEYPLPGYC